MLPMLYYTHSGTRWLVVLATLVALGFMLYSLITNREQDRVTRVIMLTFSSLVGLQWVIGLFFYLVYGNARNDYTLTSWVEHATYMTIVVIVAHLYIPFRKRASTRNYYIASLIVILAVVGLIYFGVGVLGGGMARWSFQPLFAPSL